MIPVIISKRKYFLCFAVSVFLLYINQNLQHNISEKLPLHYNYHADDPHHSYFDRNEYGFYRNSQHKLPDSNKQRSYHFLPSSYRYIIIKILLKIKGSYNISIFSIAKIEICLGDTSGAI